MDKKLAKQTQREVRRLRKLLPKLKRKNPARYERIERKWKKINRSLNRLGR